MPNNNKKRGKRGHKKQQQKEKYARSAGADTARLQKAIARSNELTHLRSERNPLPASAISQGAGHTLSGVHLVSLDSDSDISLPPPSDEGVPSQEGIGATESASSASGPVASTTTTTPTPHHTVVQTAVSDGRLILSTRIHLSDLRSTG